MSQIQRPPGVASFGVVGARTKTANSFNGLIRLLTARLLALLAQATLGMGEPAVRMTAATAALDGAMEERLSRQNVEVIFSRMMDPPENVHATKTPSRERW